MHIIDSYTNVDEWEEKAKDLASRYIQNFERYTDTEEGKRLVASGPTLEPVLF
ncbi:hypothetical protein [Flavobacterium sp. GSA192]|uniref:hypothetical protein n=1 Tax=Flavobacterium sp. GSA192 TaxID=2576304 RepID=UPI0015E36945|nr:hypothetical protein [Flavobacterium sp. GSA192]